MLGGGKIPTGSTAISSNGSYDGPEFASPASHSGAADRQCVLSSFNLCKDAVKCIFFWHGLDTKRLLQWWILPPRASAATKQHTLAVLRIRDVYPGHPGSDFFPSQIPNPGSELIPSRVPDPGSASKSFKYFNPKKWLSSRKYRIPDPGVKGTGSRIPDPYPQHWQGVVVAKLLTAPPAVLNYLPQRNR